MNKYTFVSGIVFVATVSFLVLFYLFLVTNPVYAQGENDADANGNTAGDPGNNCGNQSGAYGGGDGPAQPGGSGTCLNWSCSGGDNNSFCSCSDWSAPAQPAFVPVPTCSVSISPSQVYPGGTATLSWNSTYADYTNIHGVLASFGDDASASYPPSVVDYNRAYGSVQINPTYSRTYTVTFYNSSTGQQCVASASIGVVPAPAAPPPPPPPPPPSSANVCPPGSPGAWPNCTVVSTGGNGALCPAGQHAVGSLCVCDATNLPADSNGQCTSQVCPSGFSFDPGTGQCIAINQCALPRICSDNTHAVNQCTGAVINCALNGTGWVCRNGDCVKLPPPIASISASPGLLSPGYTANIAWTSQNTDSCQVTGNNGDGPWSGTSGSRTSSPIQAQTIYTLTCEGIDGSTVLKTATANIIPRTEER